MVSSKQAAVNSINYMFCFVYNLLCKAVNKLVGRPTTSDFPLGTEVTGAMNAAVPVAYAHYDLNQND